MAIPATLDPNLLHNLNVLTRYKPGDKFFVKKNGDLGITKSGFTQDIRRTVRNLTTSQCNRNNVSLAFSGIAERIQKLDADKTRDNIALLRQAANVFGAVRGSYEPNFLEKDTSYKLLQASERSVTGSIEDASSLVVRLLPGNENVSVLNYHNGNLDTLIKWNGTLPLVAPRDLSLKDTAALLLAVKKRRPGIIRKIACKAFAGAVATAGSLPCTALTIIKWVVCNPIEYWRKGEVTTRNPLMQLMDRVSDISESRKANDCDAKITRFSHWYFNKFMEKKDVSTADVDALCNLPMRRIGHYVQGDFTLMVSSYEDIKPLNPELFDVINQQGIKLDFTQPIPLWQVRSAVRVKQKLDPLEDDGKAGPQILATDFVRLQRKTGVFESGTAKHELQECQERVNYQVFLDKKDL